MRFAEAVVVASVVLVAGCSAGAHDPAPSPTVTGSSASPTQVSTPEVSSPSPTAPTSAPAPSAPSTPAPASTKPGGVVSTLGGVLPENEASAVAPPSTKPNPGCGVNQGDADQLYGSFDRVVNAIGRDDQSTYTNQLVKVVADLKGQSAGCSAAEKLTSMVSLADAIHSSATSGDVDLAAINSFRRVGNEWLSALGLRASLLS